MDKHIYHPWRNFYVQRRWNERQMIIMKVLLPISLFFFSMFFTVLCITFTIMLEAWFNFKLKHPFYITWGVLFLLSYLSALCQLHRYKVEPFKLNDSIDRTLVLSADKMTMLNNVLDELVVAFGLSKRPDVWFVKSKCGGTGYLMFTNDGFDLVFNPKYIDKLSRDELSCVIAYLLAGYLTKSSETVMQATLFLDAGLDARGIGKDAWASNILIYIGLFPLFVQMMIINRVNTYNCDNIVSNVVRSVPSLVLALTKAKGFDLYDSDGSDDVNDDSEINRYDLVSDFSKIHRRIKHVEKLNH